ncbi:MAG: urea carboxylase-associated protein 2 [Patiriisocius sp.]|jgi:urea carboxylase-associated protein 2
MHLTDENLIYSETFPGGGHWSMRMRAGNALRLVDIEGGANVAMLMFNPENPLEKYNMPDTLKGQHTFKLSQGNTLFSDMGRAMCSIVEDSFGWHDTATGTCNRRLVEAKWGRSKYQDAGNNYLRNGRDSFLIELGKYGLGKRDLAANLNWFTRIEVDDDGNLVWGENQSKPSDAITLRFEMDAIVIMHTCPHPLNPAKAYPRKPIRYEIRDLPPAAMDDECRLARPESERAFENTRLYHQVKGGQA